MWQSAAVIAFLFALAGCKPSGIRYVHVSALAAHLERLRLVLGTGDHGTLARPDGTEHAEWRRLRGQVARLEERTLRLLRYEPTRSHARSTTPHSNFHGSQASIPEPDRRRCEPDCPDRSQDAKPIAAMADGDLVKLRAAALELRDELETLESNNERALPEIRREVSKLESGVAQAQARATHADESQEGMQRWLRVVAASVTAAEERSAHDRSLLLKLDRTVAELARRRSRGSRHLHTAHITTLL